MLKARNVTYIQKKKSSRRIRPGMTEIWDDFNKDFKQGFNKNFKSFKTFL